MSTNSDTGVHFRRQAGCYLFTHSGAWWVGNLLRFVKPIRFELQGLAALNTLCVSFGVAGCVTQLVVLASKFVSSS